MSDKAGKISQKKNDLDLAKPLHIQRLEAAVDVRYFVNYVTKYLNSDNDTESDDSDHANDFFKVKAGTKQERCSDRQRLYNLSSVGPERQWLKNVLISSGSEPSSDDEMLGGKQRKLKKLIRQRRFLNKNIKQYYKEPVHNKFMYYGTGFLSTIDRYPDGQTTLKAMLPPPPVPRGRRGRPSERGGATRGVNRSRRGRTKDNRNVTTAEPSGDAVDSVVDWEEQIRNLKDDKDEREYSIVEKPTASSRGRKKLATMKSPEALTARRRRHWLFLVKKELGKVQRGRAANHREVMLQRKRLATLCSKHWRHLAMQSQKNMKETVWRCKRLSREMQAYWRRYDRAERETRRRMEREAEEQRKMDVELMEAKRQRRKLNFLITQTELYAHFMQRKTNSIEEADCGSEHILQHLDEDRDPRLAAIDQYDSDLMKERASRNAREAFLTERARTQQFDESAGVSPNESVAGDHDQPHIFRGTLKGYQLKGMNWLANLYDQGISGILADEMGLGKTVQCIAFLCHVAERLGVWGPFLVVSPASTLHNWQQEMERFVPDFKVVPYWGSPNERRILRQFWERKDLHTRQAAFHVVVTSYQIVVSDLKYLNRVSWQYMILDEAQAIKSSASMRWKLLLGFSCRNRLLLSGTPIQNSMAELWALLHFIMPTLFDSHEEFNEWFSKDIESHAENKSTIDEKHLSRLHMILKPFMLRRIKKDVENELSDKIEVMVHCPLTIRQKLLYIALKKKIKIEELLHYSAVGAESGHSVDKNFTSNLMNLVMQFRKVCNHPELFERRDVKSAFAMSVDDYHLPKLIADDGILIRSIPSKRHLLYNKLSIISPEYIHRSISEVTRVDFEQPEQPPEQPSDDSFFGFTRFMDLSPAELCKVMTGGWLCAMQHIESCAEKYEKIQHRQEWWRPQSPQPSLTSTDDYLLDYMKFDDDLENLEMDLDLEITNEYAGPVETKEMLLVCPFGKVIREKRTESLMWSDLLFTDPLWVDGGPFYEHTTHTHHYMPETIEHRAMRAKRLREMDGQMEMLSEIKTEDGGVISVTSQSIPEFPHEERMPLVFENVPTPIPAFLYIAQPKVYAPTRQPYAVSRAFAFHVTRHLHGESAEGAATLARLVASAKPPFGWASMQVPDKNQLVSDAGKLTVLDSLLRRLKERGHRVLIYSQMTKMIDLLEEYMWYRKHKYMRLDGSSKISARRDMVADFQVIFYDSDWNPTVDQQAMDRAHRLGQTKQVTVYRLICKGTIEERIMQRAREKSEIQRMVISGGNFKPDTLKPKEVVSLLLDDEEIELKYRQKSEEKKLLEEKEGKRKALLPPVQPTQTPSPIPEPVPETAGPPSDPGSPLDVEEEGELVVDAPPLPLTPSPMPSFSPAVRASSWASGRGRGSRRGRPRGSRHALTRRPERPQPDNAGALAAGAALLESDAPLEVMEAVSTSGLESRGRRGPGRPRLRNVVPRGPSRRPRRPREPLLVPLAPPPSN